jgi:hypothetical protein
VDASLRKLKADRIDIHRHTPTAPPRGNGLAESNKHSRVTYSAMQVDLFEKWLFHFGAIDARELDLGTLPAIHERVLEGFAPNGQGCKPYEMKLASADQPPR